MLAEPLRTAWIYPSAVEKFASLAPTNLVCSTPFSMKLNCGIDDTPKAMAESLFSFVCTAQNTILSFVFARAYASNIGLNLMQGGHVGDQKSIITPG